MPDALPRCFCGALATFRRGRLTAVDGGGIGVGVRTMTLTLCGHHMAMMINQLAIESPDGIDSAGALFRLDNWVAAELLQTCSVCDRTFYVHHEHAVRESITPEWNPIVACSICAKAPFAGLIAQVKAIATMSDTLDSSFTRADVLKFLKSHGQSPFMPKSEGVLP